MAVKLCTFACAYYCLKDLQIFPWEILLKSLERHLKSPETTENLSSWSESKTWNISLELIWESNDELDYWIFDTSSQVLVQQVDWASEHSNSTSKIKYNKRNPLDLDQNVCMWDCWWNLLRTDENICLVSCEWPLFDLPFKCHIWLACSPITVTALGNSGRAGVC